VSIIREGVIINDIIIRGLTRVVIIIIIMLMRGVISI